MNRISRTPLLAGLGIGAWLAAVVGGLVAASVYGVTPGAESTAPLRFPEGSSIVARAGRHTVVLFVHPECACSRASLRALARLERETHGEIDTTVVLAGAPIERGAIDPAAVARLVPRARVVVGEDEARRFRVRTSGQVLAYDPGRALVFSGGITAGRGHDGPSLGGESLARIVNGEEPLARSTAVFGCSLEGPKAISFGGR